MNITMMKFYDLRKRLCEERDVSGLSDLHCSGPGDDSVQITAFTRKIDPPPSSRSLNPSPFTRNTTPLKLVMPKFDHTTLSSNNLKTAHTLHTNLPTSLLEYFCSINHHRYLFIHCPGEYIYIMTILPVPVHYVLNTSSKVRILL